MGNSNQQKGRLLKKRKTLSVLKDDAKTANTAGCFEVQSKSLVFIQLYEEVFS
jgi:hypothetical protein